MAIKFFTSFDHYDTDTLPRRFDAAFGTAISISTTSGRFGGHALVIDGGSDEYLSKNVELQQGSAVIVGFAYKAIGALQETSITLTGESAGSSHEQLSINIRSDTGVIAVRRGRHDIGTLLATSSPGVISDDVWAHIEFKAVIDNSSGSVEVRVDTIPVLTISSVDTQGLATNSVTAVQVVCTGSSVALGLIDSMWVMDGTGAAPFNDFLGDKRVSVKNPKAAGTSTQFSPLSGSNYEMVDETIIDEDTTYNESGSVGAEDNFTQQTTTDIGVSPSTVYAVQTVNCVRKTDAAEVRYQDVFVSGGTSYYSADKEASSSYYCTAFIHQVDPSTGIAWTVSGLDAAASGYKLTFKET
jgi:hypothetical protein